jgi:hypothetical protein
MKKCCFEDLIDEYLLDRLDMSRREEFEEHYFNCSSCFAKMAERDALISVLKNGAPVFATDKVPAAEPRKRSLAGAVFDFLAPRQWALAGSAAFLLVAALLIIPLFRDQAPRLVTTGDETVRGSSIALVAPLDGAAAVPARFEWKAVGENTEYLVSIYAEELIWKAETRELGIALPAEIRARLVSGRDYFWQVKAFSEVGTLVAVSPRARFSIAD